jgi:hypothetical protein
MIYELKQNAFKYNRYFFLAHATINGVKPSAFIEKFTSIGGSYVALRIF